MSARPLAGVSVVDLSRYLPGPLAAQTLASLGARVIKVEEPELGDPVRYAPPLENGVSALAAQLLSGVESIALDLTKAPARQALEELLEGADVLLEAFRPGALARLGFQVDELRRRFPRLVICSLSGWGESGPRAARAGHDLTYQAVAGSLAPAAAVPAVPAADLLGASHAVTAVLAALVERGRTGEGCWIDASLFDAAVHSNLAAWAAEVGAIHGVGQAHDLAGGLAAYNLYRTSDGGWVALALLEEVFWKRFVKALGRRDLRKLHRAPAAEGRERLAALLAQRTRKEWGEFFSEHDLPAEVVLSPSEAARHPQTLARKVLGQGPDSLPRLAFPACFDGERPRSGTVVPALGEHTEALLSELAASKSAAAAPGSTVHPPLRPGRRSGIGKRTTLKGLLAKFFAKRH